jgi:oligopeptide transport system permease protein
MVGLIFRRVLWFIPVLFVISLITFLLMHAAPGGPWDRDSESKQVDPRTQAMLAAQYGLDLPLWQQYIRYIVGYTDEKTGAFKCGAICGNLGPSYRQRGKTVQQVMFDPPRRENATFLDSKFGYSIRLGLMSLAFALLLGIPAGVIAALKHNSPIDYFVTFITNVGVAVPSFVVAFFSIVVLAVGLGLIPVVQKNWGNLGAWIVPAMVFGFGTLAQTARFTRTSMLEVLKQDFVRTARAKGLQEQAVIWKHTLRNALIPVVTTIGPALAALITGSIVIENIYGIPGVGRDFVVSIGNRDYSMIMGTTLVYALLIVVGNLTVDILYGIVDPRIRVE